MKNTQDVSQVVRQLHVPASANLDERIHTEIAKATLTPSAPSGVEPNLGQIVGLFMRKKATRYTLATTLGMVLLMVFVLNRSSSSAWAMEQAIEALKKYRAVHITGYMITGSETTPLDAWARADTTGDLVEIGMARSGNITAWTRDNRTYRYDRAENAVMVEPGITFGLSPWLGPKLLTAVARMKDYKSFEGEDAATGQKRVIVTASIQNFTGPQSFLMEFDSRTKLLVSMKSWRNLKQEGAPKVYFEKIEYFVDLPDSALSFQPPADAPITDMPLWIPEANLSLLSDPACGISAEGITQEQACQNILEQFWTACTKDDLPRIHQLAPLTATWSDEMLRDHKVTQLLKIGGIERTGRSKLGSLALVPIWFRYQDGAVRKIWMIVQFRETDQGVSCVVYGPHGYALNVKD